MSENRGPWYLITGLILGLVLGLVYSWTVRPVEYINTSPASLRSDFKDQYRALIAAAYAANGDLVRARGRLSLLQDGDTYQVLAEQAQQTLADGDSPDEARALGLLAVAIGQGDSQPQVPLQATSPNGGSSSPTGQVPDATITATTIVSSTVTVMAPDTSTVVPSSPTPSQTISDASQVGETIEPDSTSGTSTPSASNPVQPTRTITPTSEPTATGTLLPTRTPTATPGAPYILQDQQKICDPDLDQPLIQVIALDSAHTQVPGVEAIATWPGGEQQFYTGLKPELGTGYADLEVTIGITYTLRLAGAGQSVSDLATFECETTGGKRYWGSWLLTFIQP